MIGQAGWSEYTVASYISHKFDRRKFNPDASPDDKQTLMTLRRQGSNRARYYNYGYGTHDANHFHCCGSTALRNLSPYDFADIAERNARIDCDDPKCTACNEVYLDLGAGDSPDVLIAQGLGYKAYSVDLFPPFRRGTVCYALRNTQNKFYIKADAVELPFADNSADYVSSQAMAALLKPAERMAFYREVHRVLKIGGTFSLTGCKLRCGYLWSQRVEHDRALELGWVVYSSNTGFVAQREA